MQRLGRSILVMCAFVTLAGLTACTAVQRPAETDAQQEARRQRDQAETSAFYKSLTQRMLQRFGDGTDDSVFDMLVLSPNRCSMRWVRLL